MNNNLLLFKKNKSPIGQKIIIKGKVINRRGNPLKGIIIEIWQANAAGKYRDKNDTHNAAIDPNFLGYGVTKTNSNGDYKFKTILPGAYPGEIIRMHGGLNIFIFQLLMRVFLIGYVHKCIFQMIFY